MRVLCINGDFSAQSNRPTFKYLKEIPVELEEYTVRDSEEIRGKVGYLLEEVFGGIGPSGKEISFDSSRFIPLMDKIQEAEKERQEELSLVLIER